MQPLASFDRKESTFKRIDGFWFCDLVFNGLIFALLCPLFWRIHWRLWLSLQCLTCGASWRRSYAPAVQNNQSPKSGWTHCSPRGCSRLLHLFAVFGEASWNSTIIRIWYETIQFSQCCGHAVAESIAFFTKVHDGLKFNCNIILLTGSMVMCPYVGLACTRQNSGDTWRGYDGNIIGVWCISAFEHSVPFGKTRLWLITDRKSTSNRDVNMRFPRPDWDPRGQITLFW